MILRSVDITFNDYRKDFCGNNEETVILINQYLHVIRTWSDSNKIQSLNFRLFSVVAPKSLQKMVLSLYL